LAWVAMVMTSIRWVKMAPKVAAVSMPTSATTPTATRASNPAMRRQAQRGFTLLEVLVVVALVALTSAILVPALLRVDTNAKVEVAAKLADTLTELSERSLF